MGRHTAAVMVRYLSYVGVDQKQLIVLIYWYLMHSINILLQSDYDIIVAVGLQH
jgi:hypothetical protein